MVEDGWALRTQSHYVAAVRSSLLALTLVSALGIAACGSDDNATTDTDTASPTTEVASATTEAPVETEAPTTEAAPATTEASLPELEVIGQGPYDVAVQTITINEGTERPLVVDVWFPIDDAAGLPAHEYMLIPGLADVSDNAVDADPAAISTDGPFPLVIYSHGSGGLRYIASDYTEAIASYGYIVASADHTGNTALDDLLCSRTTGPVTALNRVNDIQAMINAMLDPTSTETVGFVANVDPESIAVTGHSLGGFTTFAAVTGYANDLGSVAADGRIDAIIPLAPAIGGDRPPIDQSTTTTTDPDRVDRCATPDDPATPEPTAEEIEAARNRKSITDEQLASITVPQWSSSEPTTSRLQWNPMSRGRGSSATAIRSTESNWSPASTRASAMHAGTSNCSPPGPRTSRHSLGHSSFRRLRRDAATASWTFSAPRT